MLDPARSANPLIAMIDELIRLNARLRGVFAGATGPTGLNAMEATVLAAVVEARMPPTVPQIGRSLGHPRQVIQRAANALAAAGLIRTEANPHHKRAVLLLPTPEGERLKRESDARAVEAVEPLLNSFDRRRAEHMVEEIRALRTAIEAHIRSRRA